jgi:predicted DNA-binding transcriptional regulator AlpA
MNQEASLVASGKVTQQSNRLSRLASALNDIVDGLSTPNDEARPVEKPSRPIAQQKFTTGAIAAPEPADWFFHGKSKRGRLQFKHRSEPYFGIGLLIACNDLNEVLIDDVSMLTSEADARSTSKHVTVMFCRCAKSHKPYYFAGHLDLHQTRSTSEAPPPAAHCLPADKLAVKAHPPEHVKALTDPGAQATSAKRTYNKKDAAYPAEIKRIALQHAAGLDPDVRMEFVAHYLNESRANIYRKLTLGQFPMPVKRGRGAFWPMSAIEAYKAGKAQKVSHG